MSDPKELIPENRKTRSRKSHGLECFTSDGVGPLVQIQRIRDQKVYKNILVKHEKPEIRSLREKVSTR